jgi:hypothetical protein
MISSQKIVVEKGDEIVLRLRGDSHSTGEGAGEGIIDVNNGGNWVRGLEIIGHFVNFPVGKAVRPFRPVPPSAPPHAPYPPGTVTCDSDEGYEMAYLYLLYDDALLSLPEHKRERLLKIDHQIENPHCRFGLDSEGGLVWVRLPMADLSSPPEILLALLKK